jgi:CO/xanthine dehydrogenase Mo-binding subunit
MGTVAWLDADERLQVWASTQSVFLARARLAGALEMPVSRIRVMAPAIGGGFGGKIVEDANTLVAALLALKAQAPVRLVNDRLEDFLAACSSLPERITLRLGMDREGRIVAKDVHIVADCGAYSGLCAEIMHVSAMRSDNMHRLEHVRCDAKLVYTNNPPHGAFRGFGGTQMLFAINSHIDTMAHMLGLDPVAIHRLNAIGVGETSVHGWRIGSTGLLQCLTQCTQAVGWNDLRDRPKTGSRHRGFGVATAMHVSGNRTIGNWDGSTIFLKVNEDGRVVVHFAEGDMGQGAMTMLAQIVAHELDIPLSHVHVSSPDTDISPYAIGSLASRVTIVSGNAAIVAAKAARAQLMEVAASLLGVDAQALVLAGGGVHVKDHPLQRRTLAELARQHIWRHGGEGLQVKGTWDAQTVMFDKDTLMGNIAPAYSFAAQAVEVEVDTETGQVQVLQSFVADDCGKALNPMAVHGQSNGAAAQAIGWTLYEQLHLEGGRLANTDFADYTMPTIDALPEMRSGVVESIDPNGPYGAKGASETAILPGAPAIANAVYDAVGVRIVDLPITPEKVLAALQAKAASGVSHA